MIKAKCQAGSIWYVIVHLMRESVWVGVCVCKEVQAWESFLFFFLTPWFLGVLKNIYLLCFVLVVARGLLSSCGVGAQ